MPAPYSYSFLRKTYNGRQAVPFDGNPTLLSLVGAAFPGRAVRYATDASQIFIVFKEEPELTGPEVTTLTSTYDGWVPLDLDAYKASKLPLIDAEASSRITEGPGFEWPPASGQFFSLSLNAQTKWNGLSAAAQLGLFDYVLDPPKVRTKDDLIEYTIVDTPDALGMWGAAMVAVREILNNNRQAKGNVLAAADISGVDAAFDAYMDS